MITWHDRPEQFLFVCFFVVRIVVISQFNFFLVAAVACHGYTGRPISELKKQNSDVGLVI